jgi:hypothetical protein
MNIICKHNTETLKGDLNEVAQQLVNSGGKIEDATFEFESFTKWDMKYTVPRYVKRDVKAGKTTLCAYGQLCVNSAVTDLDVGVKLDGTRVVFSASEANFYNNQAAYA